jgi:hypothetical protein
MIGFAIILYQRNLRAVYWGWRNGESPYIAVEVDLCVRSPAENSGMRQDDLHIGGEGGRPRLGSWARLIAVPFTPDQQNELSH